MDSPKLKHKSNLPVISTEIAKKEKKGEEVHHAEKKQEVEDESSLKQGHFAPIRRRINKIYKKILDIKQFQNYERE